MMQETQFIEKQYLGLNKMSIFRRVSLAIFCFIAYYWRENHERSGDLFFLMGIFLYLAPLAALGAILVFCIALLICRYVSLSSIVGALFLPTAGVILRIHEAYIILGLIVSALIIIKHRENITRIITGKEPKFVKK